MPTEEQIKQLAYALWEQEGRPDGKDLEHYLTATRILEEQEAAQRRASAPQPAVPTTPSPRRPRSKKR